LDNGINQKLEYGKKYFFILNNKQVQGELVKDGSGVFLKTNNRYIGQDKVSIDLDNDGQDDLEVFLKKYDDEIFLKSNIIKKEETKLPEGNNSNNNQNSENNDDLGFNFVYLGLGLLLLVCLIIVGVVVYKKKHVQNNDDLYKIHKVKADVIEGIVSQNKNDVNAAKDIHDEILDVYENFDDWTGKILLYSDTLKDLIDEEEERFKFIKNNISKIVDQGIPWVDIDFYLKKKGLLSFYIDKIISFEFLIERIEKFVLANDVSEMQNDVLKKKLLSQKWTSQFFIHKGQEDEVLREVLFMIAGSNIYGFKKNKFENLFLEELDKGRQNYVNNNLDEEFVKVDILEEAFNGLLGIQNNLKTMSEELVDFLEQIKKSKLNKQEKDELLMIINELKIDIEKHLN